MAQTNTSNPSSSAGQGGPGSGSEGGGSPRPRRGPRGDRGDRDQRDDRFVETVVKINRCAAVVKGGRRFSFSALVVLGDRAGHVGVGFGKAKGVPLSVEKGRKKAQVGMRRISRFMSTIPHRVEGTFGASRVILVPAPEGTGIIAGAAVRSVVHAAGIKNILTKAHGNNNPVNLVKATYRALLKLRTRADVERLRGVVIRDYDLDKMYGAAEEEARGQEPQKPDDIAPPEQPLTSPTPDAIADPGIPMLGGTEEVEV